LGRISLLTILLHQNSTIGRDDVLKLGVYNIYL